MADTTPLLKVEHLSKEFPANSGVFSSRFSKRVVSAVNDVSFEIMPGETFGSPVASASVLALRAHSSCVRSSSSATSPFLHSTCPFRHRC